MNESPSDPVGPGFRWPVSVTRSIAASPAAVWAAISAPGNLERCHPFCAANPVREWPGEHARDEVHYLNGWIFERRFRRWLDGVGYDLYIGRRGGSSSFVSWRILANEAEGALLRITVYPSLLQRWPVIIRWVPCLVRVRPMLKSYLASVTAGFEWYVTRGQPVPRNQFGRHPWFSD